MRKLGFLGHYRRIKLEGTDIPSLISKCIKVGINLRNIRWINSLETRLDLRGSDYNTFRQIAGSTCRVTTVREGGLNTFITTLKKNKATVIGAFIIGALIFYQSLFIRQVDLTGFTGLDEAELRQTLREAGIYEGARKQDSYSDVKQLLYKTYPRITWLSIYVEGQLVRVNMALAEKESGDATGGTGSTADGASDNTGSTQTDDSDAPVNIVAAKSGFIREVQPLQGNSVVEEGDYVSEGDLIISGVYEYQSTDYSKGDEKSVMYSHATGKVMATVPDQITYYLPKDKTELSNTGRKVVGIKLLIGDIELNSMDIIKKFTSYKVSKQDVKQLLSTLIPFPVELSIVTIQEVEQLTTERTEEEARKVVEAALRQYEKDELDEGENIEESTIEFSQEGSLIRANVFMEVLEEIGREEAIQIS